MVKVLNARPAGVAKGQAIGKESSKLAVTFDSRSFGHVREIAIDENVPASRIIRELVDEALIARGVLRSAGTRRAGRRALI